MPELSIGRAVSWLAQQDPDAVAVRCAGEVLTRRELDEVTNAMARRWTAEGLRVDDTVAVCLPNGLDFVLATVAAWKSGATPQPLSPELSAAVLSFATPALMIDGPVDRCADESTAPVPDRFASSWKAPTSSGSTGRPKIVRAAAPARFDPEARVAAFVPRAAVQLVAGPLTHAAPFVYAMRGLMTGHELVLMAQFDPAAWLRSVQDHRVTWGMVVPSMMHRIWREPGREDHDVSSLESVLHLGARCPATLKRDWLEWLGPDRVVEVYAGTEAQGLTTITGPEWLEHPGSVGRPTGGSEFRVVGPHGEDCEPGVTGEILMRRATPTYSYVGQEPVVRDGWHTLGDAGWRDADGFLYVSDRLDDLIVTRDATVVPADVEAVLDAHPAVGSSVVVGRPSSSGGTTVHAVVQLEGELDLTDLADWARDRLDPAQRPESWELTDRRLRPDTGKTRRSDWR